MNNTNWFKRFFNSRSMKYGSNSIIMIVAVVGIAIMVNLMFTLSSLKDLKLDLTPNKVYSLGDVSKKILKNVKKDVTIYGLFDDEVVKAQSGDVNGIDYKGVMELLKKYDSYSHIKLVYKDPDKNPAIIKDIDPQGLKNIQKGAIVVKCGNKLRPLVYDDLFEYQYSSDYSSVQVTGFKAEEALTAAIKYVTADKTPVAYFLTGDDEKDPDTNYTTAKDFIEKNNYDIKTLKLMSVDKVPEDASLLVFLSPQKDLTVSDREKLRDYFKIGGNAVFLFDYMKSNPSFEQFNNLLSDYNLSLDNDIVKEKDSSRSSSQNRYLFAPEIESTDVTTTFDPNSSVALYQARSVTMLKNQKDYLTLFELMKSSDLAEGEQIDKSKGPSLTGPMDLAVAVESKAYSKPSRILVFGNSQFISDGIINQYGSNGLNFLLDSLNWIQDNKDSIDISAKQNVESSMILSASQSTILTWTTVVILPLLILGLGTFVWFRRRHL